MQCWVIKKWDGNYQYDILRLIRFSCCFLFVRQNLKFTITNKLDINSMSKMIDKNQQHRATERRLLSRSNFNRLESRFKNKCDYRVYQSQGYVILYKVKKERGMSSVFIGDVFSDSANYDELKNHLYAIQFAEKAFFLSTYISCNHSLNEVYSDLNFKSLRKKSPLGIKLLNSALSIRDLHDNLALSYLDLDTF